eukprot:gene2534-2903_t
MVEAIPFGIKISALVPDGYLIKTFENNDAQEETTTDSATEPSESTTTDISSTSTGNEQENRNVIRTYPVVCLPSITLGFDLPAGYPEHPPKLFIACCWLSLEQMERVIQELDSMWEKGELIIFRLADWRSHHNKKCITPFGNIKKNGPHYSAHFLFSWLTMHTNLSESLTKRCTLAPSATVMTMEQTLIYSNALIIVVNLVQVTFGININIKSGEVQSIKCSEPECKQPIDQNIVEKHVTPDMFIRYKSLLKKSSGFTECRRCQKWAKVDPDTRSSSPCNYNAKEDIPLRSVDRIKACPGCGIHIWKYEGCNKVVCGSCHSKVCWLCLRVIQGYEHFGTSCQLFEIPSGMDRGRGRGHIMIFDQLTGAATCTRCKARVFRYNYNNHVFCRQCGGEMCFLCKTMISGTKHFSSSYTSSCGIFVPKRSKNRPLTIFVAVVFVNQASRNSTGRDYHPLPLPDLPSTFEEYKKNNLRKSLMLERMKLIESKLQSRSMSAAERSHWSNIYDMLTYFSPKHWTLPKEKSIQFKSRDPIELYAEATSLHYDNSNDNINYKTAKKRSTRGHQFFVAQVASATQGSYVNTLSTPLDSLPPNKNNKEKRRILPSYVTPAVFVALGSLSYLYWDQISDSSIARNIRVIVTGIKVTLYYKWYLRNVERVDKEFAEKIKIANKLAAEAMVDLCVKNKGIFIKVAQILASLDHLLPVEYTSALSVFQDHAPYEPFSEVVKLFKIETGKHPDEIYQDFEREPIASASLAQVHRAKMTMEDGTVREVAVKVQYPNLTDRFEQDIESIYNVMLYINWFFPQFEFSWLLPEATSCLQQELDFINEGRNSEKIAALFDYNHQLYIPKVYWNHTTKRILTMEFIHGVRIDDKAGLERLNIDVGELYYLFSEVFAEQIFVHGFLHSDPHPGNILVRNKDGHPEMVLLDHGLYKKIDEKVRVNFCQLWRCMCLGDFAGSEQYARALGAGEYAKHLGILLNLRPEKSRENLRNMKRELGTQTLSAITDILKNLPKEILLVLKTNNLIRQITSHFKIKNGFMLMAKSCLKGIYQSDDIITKIKYYFHLCVFNVTVRIIEFMANRAERIKLEREAAMAAASTTATPQPPPSHIYHPHSLNTVKPATYN